MYELDVQQQNEVTGGLRGFWKFIAENFVSEMGNGELYPDGYLMDTLKKMTMVSATKSTTTQVLAYHRNSDNPHIMAIAT